MIRSLRQGFAEAFCSPATVVATVLIGAFEIFQALAMPPDQVVNAWDVIIAVLSDAKSSALIGIIWWYLMLVPVLTDSARELRLIRDGTIFTVCVRHLWALVGKLGAAAAQVVLATLGIVLGFGYEWRLEWSAWARSAVADGFLAAYSSPAYSAQFDSPTVLLVLVALFSGMGMLSTGAVALALAVRGYPLTAMIGYGVFVVWTMWSSFAVELPTFIDTSAVVTFGWATLRPNGLLAAVLWWTVCLLLAAGLALWPVGTVGWKRLVNSRWASLSALWALALLGILPHIFGGSPGPSPVLRGFFAGPFGDIVSYTIPVIISIAFATSFLARLQEETSGYVLYRALRAGSYRRWIRSHLVREITYAALLTTGLGALLLIMETSNGQPLHRTLNDPSYAVSLVGFFAVTIVLVALAAGFIWLPTPREAAWLTAMGATLVLGYLPPSGTLSSLSVLVPYALDPGLPPDSLPVIQLIGTISLAATASGVVLVRAVPRHADALY